MATLKQLLARKKKLEEAIEKENAKTIRVMNNIGWGAGMRRTKVTPSFARLERLEESLHDVDLQILTHKKEYED